MWSPRESPVDASGPWRGARLPRILADVTTATHSPYTYVYDPSGTELRRALASAPELPTSRIDAASLVLTAVAGLTLLAGLLRVVVG